MHAGVISKLLYGSASVRATIHSLKLADYLTVQTHKPYKYDLVLLWVLTNLKIEISYL